MEERLYKLYDDIDSVEEEIERVETRIYNVRQQKISGDNIYQFLLYFDKLYDKFRDAEKKEFLNSFIERVDIYEQEQPDGRFLKHIKFRFPVYFNGKEIEEMGKENLLALEDEEFYEAMICLCDDAVYDIKAAGLTKEQILAYSLYMFEMEVNNGGLCQFFVNSSSDCAPFISEALEAIGATELRNLFEQFVNDNDINITDLSSFKIADVKEYEAQTKRFDFDSFDEKFYDNENFHQQVIDYFRCNVEQLLKN